MFQSTLIGIFKNIWPMLVIVSIILTVIRVSYNLKNNKRFTLCKDLFTLLFILYICCLFYIVTSQDVNFGKSNLVPFKEMFRYELFSDKFIKNVMGNVILFIPYGFFISYYLNCKKIWYPSITTLLVSFTIETVQYYIGRVFDIDDIILNVLGGIFGYLIFIIFNAIKKRLPKFLKNDNFLNFVVIIVIIVLVFLSFNGKMF